jgi:endonuclease/exonuclease/phosphatase family metal-dependent hydrolase
MILVRVLLSTFLLLAAAGNVAGQITIMSFNIRYDNPDDGENRWENRRFEVAALITQHKPDFLGIQEGLNHQVTYLKGELKGYNYIGVGREDGQTKGEYAAIFYQPAAYEVVDQETFWLSETPEKPSKGWDAALERICTYGAFRDRESGKMVYVFNAHFDHVGELARLKSAELILKKVAEKGISDSAVIFMGDLNSTPESAPVLKINEVFTDGKRAASTFICPFGTFNGFDVTQPVTTRIDYIFVRNCTVGTYRHFDEKRNDGLWFSDHLPVLCEIEKL